MTHHRLQSGATARWWYCDRVYRAVCWVQPTLRSRESNL